MIEISFLYPKLLLLLLLVPFFIAAYFFSFVYNKKRSLVFPNFEAMQRISEVEIFSKNYIALYLNIIIISFLVFAVSGMSVSFTARTSSFSYVLAIDNSLSMSSNDILPSRLEAAKISASKFIDALPSGVEIGVLEFSGDATIIQELELSKMKLKLSIDSISFGQVQGTNIYNALISANKILADRPLKSVIIISDGQINVGDAPQIIAYAKKNNIVISTIAIGTEEGGVTELNTVSKLDSDFLKSLAFNTEGKFFEAKSLDNLEESFNEIVSESNKKITLNLDFYLILISIVLFSITWILYSFRFRTIP